MARLPRSNEEYNFLKASLLVTNAVRDGLQSIVQQHLEEILKYDAEKDHKHKVLQSCVDVTHWDFQRLSWVLKDYGRVCLDSKSFKGIECLCDARSEFFRHLNQNYISNSEFETLKENVLLGHVKLDMPLDKIHKICDKSTFSEDETLTVYEQLSKESRTCYHLSESPCHTIIQRPKELSLVLKQLENLKQSSTQGNATVYIVGEHGCGKSELAKQISVSLFNQHTSSFFDSIAVMTLNAETEDSLLSSYLRFAREILCNSSHVEVAATSKGLRTGERIRLLKCIIGTQLQNYSEWVVTIDNVYSLEGFSSYWPKPGSEEWGHGNIIVTTPNTKGDHTFSSDHSQHVTLSHGLQPSEAIQLLCEVSNVSNKDYALEVAELLRFQPCFLISAAAVVKNRFAASKAPWKMYLEMVHESSAQATSGHGDICEASSIAVRMFSEQLLSSCKDISKMLFLVSLFCPFPVNKQMISQCLNVSDTEIERIIQHCSPCLVAEDDQDAPTFVLVHDEILNVLHHDLTEVESISILGSALASVGREVMNLPPHCNSILNNDVRRLSFSADTLMNAVKTLTEQQLDKLMDFFKTLPDTTAVDILLELAKLCHLIQRLENAKTYCELAKELLKDGKEDSTIALKVVHKLGEVCKDMGDDEARSYFEHILKHRRSADESISGVADELGDVCIGSGDISTAKKLYTEALEIRLNDTQPDQSLDVATSWCKLGNVYAMEESFQLAQEQYKKALDLWDTVQSDACNSDLVKILTCAGAMSVCLEDYESAKQYLGRAMGIEERLCSRFHPCRVSSLKNAANASKALDDADDAEDLLKQSLEISQKVIGSFDSEVARIFSELGSHRTAHGDWESAIGNYSDALEIRENILCELHPDIADSCCDLGHAYVNLGDLENAKKYLERCLGIRGLLYKGNHPDLGTSYSRLGEVYNKLGDNQTGLSLLERAVEIRAQSFGIEHPKTLASIYLLGNSFARLGQLGRAKDLYQTVAEGHEKHGGSEDDLAKVSTSLAEVSLALGKVDVAKEQYKRAVEIQRKIAGEDDPELARPLVSLALVHEHCREMNLAKPLLEKALDIYTRSGHSQVLITEMHLKRVLAKIPQPRCSVM